MEGNFQTIELFLASFIVMSAEVPSVPILATLTGSILTISPLLLPLAKQGLQIRLTEYRNFI